MTQVSRDGLPLRRHSNYIEDEQGVGEITRKAEMLHLDLQCKQELFFNKSKTTLIGTKHRNRSAPQKRVSSCTPKVKDTSFELRGEPVKCQPRRNLEVRGRRLGIQPRASAKAKRDNSSNVEAVRDLSIEGFDTETQGGRTHHEHGSYTTLRNVLDSLQGQSWGRRVDTTTSAPREIPQEMKAEAQKELFTSREAPSATLNTKAFIRSNCWNQSSKNESEAALENSPNKSFEFFNVETNSACQTPWLKLLSPRHSQTRGQKLRSRGGPGVGRPSVELKFGVKNPTRRCVGCNRFKRRTPRTTSTKRSVKGRAGLEPILGREEPSRNLHAELGNE